MCRSKSSRLEIGALKFQGVYFGGLDLTTPEFSGVVNFEAGQGAVRTREVFNLPKHECMVLVTGYSAKLRSAVLKRWQLLEDAEAERQQAALARQQAALADEREARAKLQKEYNHLSFQILTGTSAVKVDMYDWKLRFAPLISAYNRKPDEYGFKHTPKDAVDALAPYADDALKLISIALNARMALGTSMLKCGVDVDVVHKVMDEFVTCVNREAGR